VPICESSLIAKPVVTLNDGPNPSSRSYEK